MRTYTITKTVYKFEELDERTQDKIINNFSSNMDYPWSSENEDTLSEFEKIFPVKVKDWEYGYRNFINYQFTESEDIENLSGWRLATYIWNNYKTDLFKGKYYHLKVNHPVKHRRVKSTTFKNGNTHNAYYSAIKLENSCVLTGYCIDDNILDPIYKFLKKPNNSTFGDLMNDCLHAWLYACEKDYEYQFSRECIIETIEANEYEFDENGNIA